MWIGGNRAFLALHTVRGVNLESRSQFTRLDIAKGYAEMAILSSEDSNIIQCEEEDFKQLFLNLSKLKQKYDEMNFVRKIVMNFPDKVKYEMVQFLLQKLKDYSNVETISSLYAKRPSESMQINLEDLVFPSRCRRISGGDYNSFYEASWLGIKVALKEFDYYISKEAFNYEVDLLMAAQCPFVIPLYGWSINMIDHTCYLIQEFVSSNLETLVAEKRTLKKTLHMPVVVDLMLQLSRAMEHLHDNKLVHGDLCPANILIEPLSSSPELMEKGYGHVKLSNFSPRKLILDSFRMKNLHYIAPEVWPETLTDQPNYSFESDVYSFAMCFAYSLTGEEPFKGITSITVLKKMVEGGERPNLPSHCPLIFRELLMNCWSTDPSSRPSFAMITMSLRLFKVLIMKTRASDRSSDTAMLKEYSLSAPMISYIELSAATTGFSNKANNITMFSMYHGVLSDGTKVLVQSTRDSTNMRQLWTKVSQLLQLRHGNIISLRAVSPNGPKCWFVYEEKVPIQGSLDALLEEGTFTCEKPLLDITCCYKIVLGVACGLQYLHGQDLTFVITPESILLDEKHEPMIVVDSIPSEGSLTDVDLENHQCLGVMHFGTLISKLLTYLRHFFVEVDSDHVSTRRALDNQVMVLGEVESLCSAGVLKMNEVVEMLESGYDAYVENNAFYEQQPYQEVF